MIICTASAQDNLVVTEHYCDESVFHSDPGVAECLEASMSLLIALHAEH
jgi:hypothetical protein